MIWGPISVSSRRVTRIFWKVLRDVRMDPPIQIDYMRSGGAIILTSTDSAICFVIAAVVRILFFVYNQERTCQIIRPYVQ